MKVTEFKLDGEYIFVLTSDGKLLYTDVTEDEISWFDITPQAELVTVIGQTKGEDTEEGNPEGEVRVLEEPKADTPSKVAFN